jgi:hypothetical protein
MIVRKDNSKASILAFNVYHRVSKPALDSSPSTYPVRIVYADTGKEGMTVSLEVI